MYAFGANRFGQLGLGDNEANRNTPTLIPGITAKQVVAGGSHSLIVGYAM